MDLLAWLQSIPEYPKIYWKERNSTKAFAGAGLKTSSTPSYAWRHFSSTTAPHWIDFPNHFSFSPRLTQESDTSSALLWEKPFIQNSIFLPDPIQWRHLVEKTLQSIKDNLLEKCVLARECILQLKKPINPWPLASALEKKIQNAYLICIQPSPRSAFISFTPEKLFSRTDQTLSTEALAGTQKQRHPSILSHPKYKREFRLVEKSIRQALLPLTQSPLSFSPPSLRTTSGLQHLYSHLETTLPPHITDQNLLDQLHPTAALLGYPKSQAWNHLQSLEPFDRGLYGAPLGRITENSSDWVVGIRSCLLFESTIRLYSGAGLVKGSDPMIEWEELDHKLHLWKELLF
jgi:menaquinone-specific isochorismate synthase